MPPAATNTSPVIKDEEGEQRNDITEPISSGRPNLKKKHIYVFIY